jgi:hypothetical protein
MLQDIIDSITYCDGLTVREKYDAVENLKELNARSLIDKSFSFRDRSSNLNELMTWACTPQGHEYWKNIYLLCAGRKKPRKKIKINEELERLQDIEEME